MLYLNQKQADVNPREWQRPLLAADGYLYLGMPAQALKEQDERTESLFRQSMEAEKNKEDLLEKKFAEALKKAKDAPEGRPLREFDLD